MVTLPLRLILFWYPQAFLFFGRTWHNTMLFLEEDMAVGLMVRLLFTPLFHDSSFVGRIISFVFRFARIIIGILAFISATLFITFSAVVWFSLPLLIFLSFYFQIPEAFYLLSFMALFGITLFINYSMHKPLKKIWQIKVVSDIWGSTKLNKDEVTWENLLQTDDVKIFLSLLEITPAHFGQRTFPLTDELLQKTIDLAKKTPDALYITPSYFFVAMISTIPNINTELLKIDLSIADFEAVLAYMEMRRNKWRKVYIWDEDFNVKHLKGVNRGWLSAPTPALDSVSTDLTLMASRVGYPEFIGREGVVTQVVNILSQERDRNVLLVGAPGSGRSALVGYLASKIIAGDAPPSLATKRLVSLDLTKLLSTGTTEGDLAKKIKEVFEEISFIQDVIVYVDELHNLGIGEAGVNYNLYSLMLPYLESDRFQFLSSTDPANYAKIIERNTSFARIFHKVELPPASAEETIEIVENRAIDLARHQKIIVTFPAIKELVRDAGKLIHNRVLPDSALSVLEECEVVAGEGKLITKDLVKKTLSKEVNVPVVELDSTQKDLLLKLEDIIHQKLIDQVEAVKAVATSLRRSAASLREENRPIGSFLFVGPTGVGKTELAKILSETYFKSSGAFIRFDMSEYQTPDAVDRLIGRQDNPGVLTEIVKNKPYALLLLDEFEKANPIILNLFLQVLDDGRLTDASSGTTIDFTNTIIIATSNAASLTIARSLSKNEPLETIEKQVKDELLKVFKPELINRFDEVVIFKPLSEEDLEKVVSLKLKDLQKLLKNQGYLIEFDPMLIKELAKKGYDPVLGARPLRRLIQDTLEARLSVMILENKLVKGETFNGGIDLLSN